MRDLKVSLVCQKKKEKVSLVERVKIPNPNKSYKREKKKQYKWVMGAENSQNIYTYIHIYIYMNMICTYNSVSSYYHAFDLLLKPPNTFPRA